MYLILIHYYLLYWDKMWGNFSTVYVRRKKNRKKNSHDQMIHLHRWSSLKREPSRWKRFLNAQINVSCRSNRWSIPVTQLKAEGLPDSMENNIIKKIIRSKKENIRYNWKSIAPYLDRLNKKKKENKQKKKN